MPNNRKRTRGRKYVFTPATYKKDTAFGPVTVQDPKRKTKWYQRMVQWGKRKYMETFTKDR